LLARRRLARRLKGQESIGDLVRDYHGHVVRVSDVTKQCTQLCDLIATLCERLCRASSLLAFVEFRAVVRRYAVDNEQTDIVPFDNDWDLIAQDVILSFQVMYMRALNAAKRRLLVRRK